ncbi:DUF4013 domain-containing protein [Natrarchaeobaculum sulfurireducens]|uniref:DUF4013 domain-containing protein n=1 Tax=Natrarchaeobaculum sulfurireducens TaxID=2044521 RepID=A0A346PIH8_9EURY|nr:DUF4013 domain-containing protein [Natrarchaeobaculum sulfurireducens]AXR79323.1 hypothetical protein AArc1_3015 [Natrarchaeobaculum sulfurireducens]
MSNADVLSYPIRGQWLERTILGGLLVFGSVLVVPVFVLVGYFVRVVETTLEGADEPPSLEGWSTLAKRGIGAIVITVAYLLVPLVAGILLAIGIGAIGYAGLTGLAPLVGGHGELVWGISLVAALLAALLSVVVFGVTLLVYYLLPAALTRYARVGTTSAAFDRDGVASLALTRDYFFAMAVLQVLPLAVPVIVLVCLLTVVGIVALPAILFLFALAGCRVLGTAGVTSSVTNGGRTDGKSAAQMEPE